MNDYLQTARDRVQSRRYRKGIPLDDCFAEIRKRADAYPTVLEKEANFFRDMCRHQKAVILPGEKIVFTRTVGKIPPAGGVSNVCANWGLVLRQGLGGRRAVAEATLRNVSDDPEKTAFLKAAVSCLEAWSELIVRHADEAARQGRDDLAPMLRYLAAGAPRNFHEALQLHHFVREVLRLAGHAHTALGRFDQYMYPFLRDDLDVGRLSLPGAEELLAECFIAMNRNTDLYFGVQMGDNGQSMVLGGVTPDGRCAVNELTWMCLRVSEELKLIDPKINLRIDANTDSALLVQASRLTRCGLGFPQYSNDDVVIPGLVKQGYDLEDARDYVVAACWEFIIPGKGMDIPNIQAVSFPHAVDAAIRDGLQNGEDFPSILSRVREDIHRQVDIHVKAWWGRRYRVAPLYSCFLDRSLETGLEAEEAAKYRNFGIHGTASSSGADALVAVRKLVFEDKSISGRELLQAMKADWGGHESLRRTILNDCPKVGNNDPQADELLSFLFDHFADACEAYDDNGRNGRIRAGTGSAMFFVYLTDGRAGGGRRELGATADGRKRGEAFPSSLAPSPGVKVQGPISVLQSFSKIDYQRICNGGPITLELSDTVFRDEEDLEKVAALVQTFVRLHCQQLQLNVLNPDMLRDAQAHPERYRNLVVRVWGWSGYFCELDPEYQNQIIRRHAFGI